MSVIDYTIGENVRTLSKRRGYTNETLGRQFGLGQSAMSRKLRGQRAWSAADVKFAADLLGVRMAVLNGEEPLPEPTVDATVTNISAPRTRRAAGGAGEIRTLWFGDDDGVTRRNHGSGGEVIDLFTREVCSESVA